MYCNENLGTNSTSKYKKSLKSLKLYIRGNNSNLLLWINANLRSSRQTVLQLLHLESRQTVLNKVKINGNEKLSKHL